MSDIATRYYKTPYGELVLGAYGDRLCLCDWRYRKMRTTLDNRLRKFLGVEIRPGDNPLLDETSRQLDEYFSFARRTFTLPLLQVGTDFQKRVWAKLMRVPFGETSTYLALAEAIGNPKAVRAVASANGANALAIVVPCHRIIGSNGELVGYAGGLRAKEKLLALEQDMFADSAA